MNIIPQAALINEITAGIVNPRDVTCPVAGAAVSNKNSFDFFPNDKQPQVVETVSLEKSRTVNSFAISEPNTITIEPKVSVEDSYIKFDSLRYFQKLKAIKEMNDIDLLKMITLKSNYPQLVHNCKNRLREITK